MMGFKEAYRNGRKHGKLFGESLNLEKEILVSPPSDFFYTTRTIMERKRDVDIQIKNIPQPEGFLEELAYLLGQLRG